MERPTDHEGYTSQLESMSVAELLHNINREDQLVLQAVNRCIPQVEGLIQAVVPRMREGGRLFYIGAGTSGRLGIIDASDCPPSFGISEDMVIGLTAGGDQNLREAIETAEEDMNQAWKDLEVYMISDKDSLIGISASGATPYVLGGIWKAHEAGVLTGALICQDDSPLGHIAEHVIELLFSSTFLTSSTRMKVGTAQKLVLNMISNTIMIQLGFMKGDSKLDLQLTNRRLMERGIRMMMEAFDLDPHEALQLIEKYGSVKEAMDARRSRR